MKRTCAEQIAQWTGGRLVAGDPRVEVGLVSTDTRRIGKGALFVPLRGERFDGHDYFGQAVVSGAAGVLCESGRLADVPEGVFVVGVDDALRALQDLAANYRKSLGIKSVVITGSNGKTSTKDMVRAVLATRARVCATAGNLNNHIGLPLTVLSTEPDDDYGVWEIGMNHPGEIAPLAAIAGPDTGVITHIGTAHVGHMGSRDAIALEKGMLAEALPEQGCLVLNADDPYADGLAARTRAKVIRAGLGRGEVRAKEVRTDSRGSRFQIWHEDQNCEAFLPIPGTHMVSNALLAAAVGIRFGYKLNEISHALSTIEITPGRLQRLEWDGVVIIQDAYNANLDSMRAALLTVSEMESVGRHCAVLGQMGELGGTSGAAHREIGRLAAELRYDVIMSVGGGDACLMSESARESGAEALHCADHTEAAGRLRETLNRGDLVLLKGSRGATMEKIYEQLRDSS